jgi:hypothetical protein
MLSNYEHIRSHNAVSSTQQLHQQQHHNIPHEQDRHKQNITSRSYYALLYIIMMCISFMISFLLHFPSYSSPQACFTGSRPWPMPSWVWLTSTCFFVWSMAFTRVLETNWNRQLQLTAQVFEYSEHNSALLEALDPRVCISRHAHSSHERA